MRWGRAQWQQALLLQPSKAQEEEDEEEQATSPRQCFVTWHVCSHGYGKLVLAHAACPVRPAKQEEQQSGTVQHGFFDYDANDELTQQGPATTSQFNGDTTPGMELFRMDGAGDEIKSADRSDSDYKD